MKKNNLIAFLPISLLLMTGCNSAPKIIQVTLKGVWGTFSEHTLVSEIKLNTMKGIKLSEVKGYTTPTPFFNEVYSFKGWALDMYGNNPIDENYIFEDSTTIYAQYNKTSHPNTTYLLYHFNKNDEKESTRGIVKFKYKGTATSIEVNGLRDKTDYTVDTEQTADLHNLSTITIQDTVTPMPYAIKITGGIDEFSLASYDSGLINATYTDGNTYIYSVALSDSNTVIPDYAYTTCDWLMAIDLPNNITEIKEGAFDLCISLTFFEAPEKLESIGDVAFLACPYLHHVYFNNNLTSIGERAFCACAALEEVNLPNSLTNMGAEAFRLCVLNQNITLGSGLNIIPAKAFSENVTLTSIHIPNNIQLIDNAAFQYCSSLENITFEDGDIPIVLNQAFQYDVSITKVAISNRVKNLGTYTFNHTLLAELDLTANKEVVDFGEHAIGVDTPIAYLYGKIIVPKDKVQEYKNAIGWKDLSSIIVGI